jgi:heme-degrading monooxygenase HmoA
MQYARVSTYSSDDPDALMAGFEGVTDELKQVAGFSHAYFLIDPNHKRGISITFWDDEAALNESSRTADELRERGAGEGRASIDSVESFQVRLTV